MQPTPPLSQSHWDALPQEVWCNILSRISAEKSHPLENATVCKIWQKTIFSERFLLLNRLKLENANKIICVGKPTPAWLFPPPPASTYSPTRLEYKVRYSPLNQPTTPGPVDQSLTKFLMCFFGSSQPRRLDAPVPPEYRITFRRGSRIFDVLFYTALPLHVNHQDPGTIQPHLLVAEDLDFLKSYNPLDHRNEPPFTHVDIFQPGKRVFNPFSRFPQPIIFVQLLLDQQDPIFDFVPRAQSLDPEDTSDSDKDQVTITLEEEPPASDPFFQPTSSPVFRMPMDPVPIGPISDEIVRFALPILLTPRWYKKSHEFLEFLLNTVIQANETSGDQSVEALQARELARVTGKSSVVLDFVVSGALAVFFSLAFPLILFAWCFYAGYRVWTSAAGLREKFCCCWFASLLILFFAPFIGFFSLWTRFYRIGVEKTFQIMFESNDLRDTCLSLPCHIM